MQAREPADPIYVKGVSPEERGGERERGGKEREREEEGKEGEKDRARERDAPMGGVAGHVLLSNDVQSSMVLLSACQVPARALSGLKGPPAEDHRTSTATSVSLTSGSGRSAPDRREALGLRRRPWPTEDRTSTATSVSLTSGSGRSAPDRREALGLRRRP
ncbi:unnamed protein product [Prorocentrum cordatum]|uniref:Uncharacterized protein n=2 Tax=Prorocentrum cordatum TaxID=2364126 RepID=A0ABN9YDF2_9DINO|nr:unnamed protein product [Polarella glacialis]